MLTRLIKNLGIGAGFVFFLGFTACQCQKPTGSDSDGNADKTAGNQPPVISEFKADESQLVLGATTALTVDAKDPEDDVLTFTYNVSAGTVSGNGAAVQFTAPNTDALIKITVSVSDGKNEPVTKEISITVGSASGAWLWTRLRGSAALPNIMGRRFRSGKRSRG